MLRSPSTRGQVNNSVFISPVSGKAAGSSPAGEIGPKSITSARPPPGGWTTIKPMPPRPLFHGSRTASAKAVATTASTALPPAASTSAPTPAATPFWAATMPPRETAAGFFTTQFCINGAISADLDRIDPAIVEGVMAGQPHRLVIGRAIGPDRVLRALRAGTVADFDRPIGAVALERAIGVVLGRPQQVEPHVFFGQVMYRPVAGLLDAQRGGAVGDDLAGEGDAHAPGLGQEIDAVLGLGGVARGGVRHDWAPLDANVIAETTGSMPCVLRDARFAGSS